jgi:hypothetical protein
VSLSGMAWKRRNASPYVAFVITVGAGGCGAIVTADRLGPLAHALLSSAAANTRPK